MAGRVWSCLVATGRDSTSFSIALDLVLTPGQRLMPGDRRCFVLFVRGKVFVGTGEDDFASAFRVEDGVFTWVGGADAPDARPLGDEPVIDLQGATVLPGLLDVHTHPALMAQIADAVDVLPPAVTSIEALVEALRSSPAHGAGPGVWIRGFGFDDAKYPEGRWPDRHDMDRVSTTQPVFVQRCDGHSVVCNSVALALTGITFDTPDPANGHYGRDEEGRPDGRLVEPSAWLPMQALMPAADEARRIADLRGLGPHFADHGLVGVADLAATFTPDPLVSFRAAAAQAWFPQTGLYLLWQDICDAPPTLAESDRTGRVRVAGVKVLLDGAYSNATAWCHDPYPSTGGRGLRTATTEHLRQAAAWARENGVQVSVHAMGDAAIDCVLEEFEDEPSWLGDLPAVRIEHATLFSPQRIERVRRARMRFAVVSHSIFFFAEYEAYATNLSPSQFAHAYPIKSFYERLPFTALSSDTPATAWSDSDNVFTSIQAAVTRRAWNGADIGAHEAITVPQAVLLYTARAAQCLALDGLGSIVPGNSGTFVVLDRDVFSVPHEELGAVRVAQTWDGGVRRFP